MKSLADELASIGVQKLFPTRNKGMTNRGKLWVLQNPDKITTSQLAEGIGVTYKQAKKIIERMKDVGFIKSNPRREIRFELAIFDRLQEADAPSRKPSGKMG